MLEKIKIGPWWYKIEYRPLTQEELELLELEKDEVAGVCLKATKTIVIVPEYRDKIAVLIHEIAHAIDYEFPFSLIDDPEARTDLIAMMLVQVIGENPKLVDMIRNLQPLFKSSVGHLDEIEARLMNISIDLNLLLEDFKEVRRNVE